MKRRLFTIPPALSLVLCLTSVVLWHVDHGNTPPNLKVRGFISVFGWTMSVGAGGFSVNHYRELPQPRSVENAQGTIDSDLSNRVCGYPWELLGVQYRSSPKWNWGSPAPRLVVGVLDMWSARYWCVRAVTAPLPMLWLATLGWQHLRGRRHVPGTCTKCGYDLRASKERCPECGALIQANAESHSQSGGADLLTL